MFDLKKILIIFFIILLIVGIIVLSYFFIFKNNSIPFLEYTPEEEISEEQLRQTIVSLYFKSNNELVPEARLVDVRNLIENPYIEILNMLIEGPKNDSLERTIPEGTKINNIKLDGENLIIDFSKEFIENFDNTEFNENLTINSIVNTLTELTEINGISILINGEENKTFNNSTINFSQVFSRE